MRISKTPIPTQEAIAALPPGKRMYLGYGLVLIRNPNGYRYWAYRYKKPSTGKPGEFTIGPWPRFGYADAREIQNILMVAVLNGQDPVQIERDKRKAKLAKQRTFADVCTIWIDNNKRKWSPRTLSIIERMLFKHCAELGRKPLAAITPNNISDALKLLCRDSPVIARRTLAKIHTVMNFAIGKEYRQPPNPARWEGLHKDTWPGQARAEDYHFPSLAYEQVPFLIQKLRQLNHPRAAALEFLILTLARRDEARLANWSEFDFQNRIWIVPWQRTKQRRDHRVPLSDRVMEMLHNAPKAGLIFTEDNRSLPTNSMLNLLREFDPVATLHGFRTSFIAWGNTTSFKDSHLNKCNAHLVGTKTDRAYDREDSLKERVPIMHAWAKFCEGIAPH